MAKKAMKIKQARKQKFSTREYTRCRVCGRPHSVLRKYGICRVCFRDGIQGRNSGSEEGILVTGSTWREQADYYKEGEQAR